jgi:DNA-binding transcriptional LysR family regulator
MVMHETNLRHIDLNLLIALEALLEEKHVSRAALRINLSQSAMSRALARLREAFNDPPIQIRSATPRLSHDLLNTSNGVL